MEKLRLEDSRPEGISSRDQKRKRGEGGSPGEQDKKGRLFNAGPFRAIMVPKPGFEPGQAYAH